MIDGREDLAVPAARRIFFQDAGAAPLIKRQAARVLQRTGHGRELPEWAAEQPMHPTTKWRSRTRLNPHDALAWTELALQHTINGQTDAAGRAIAVAVQLAGNDRHVLRSAARFYLHANDPEKAHDIILRSPATTNDPWLLAAELSISELASRSPRMIKKARLIEAGDFSPRMSTELSGALATLELVDGSVKKARKLFANSMRDPTGNALAQAEWAHISSVHIPDSRYRSAIDVGEACAFRALQKNELVEALAACERWSAEEPYSIRPFEFGAAIAGALAMYDEAILFAQRGLQLRPGAEKLVNALAFSFASIDKYSEAERIISHMNPSSDEHAQNIAIANRGLIAFRRGDIEIAHALYKDAIRGFHRSGDREAEATAKIYLAREALRINDKNAKDLLQDANKSWKNFNNKNPHPELARLMLETENALAIRPKETPQTFRTWNTSGRLLDDSAGKFLETRSYRLISRVNQKITS